MKSVKPKNIKVTTVLLFLLLTILPGNAWERLNNLKKHGLALPQNQTVSADPQSCNAMVDYVIPTEDGQGNTYTVSQLTGLPGGSAFPLGTTTNTFRIVSDQGSAVTYDFESLTVGLPIKNQDGWFVRKTGTGTGANTNMALVQSLAANGGFEGSQGMEVIPLGGNNQLRMTRLNDANFSLPTAESDDVIEVIFDHNRNHWGSYLAFGFDQNGDGNIGDGEITFGVHDRDLDDLTRVHGPDLSTLASDTKPDYGWTQWKVVIDLAANNGSGSISVAYRDLVNDGPFIEPASFQNLNAGFDFNATDNTNPGLINGMIYRHAAGGATQLDNIRYTVKDGLTHSFDVTVEDNTAPNALAKNITVELDANGNATIVPSDIDNGSNDACGAITLSIDKTIFNCLSVGPNEVTLTVIDENDNESSAISIVTVEDNIAPEFLLTADLVIDTDPNQCNAIVDYVTPFATDNCETYTVAQTAGLPSGSVFPLGTTANTFRIVGDQGTTVTYDFESLTVGLPIKNQDGWFVRKTGTGTGANTNMALVQSLAANGGFEGSQGMEVIPLGGNNQLRMTRLNDANFSLPTAESDDVIEVIFDHNRNHWGSYLAFGFDQNGDGNIGDGEITFGVHDRDLDDLTRVHGPDLSTLASDTKPDYGWTQWKVVIDLAANNGSGSISVAYRDLVNDGPFIEPAAFQNLNAGFDFNATDNTNPGLINGMIYRHAAGGATQLDNIQYTVKDGLTHSFEVTVNDVEVPVLTLTGSSVINLNIGDTYVEQGATVSDNCSASLTIGGDVVSTSGVASFTITYDAVDPSGNAATQLTRTVNVLDNVAPVITANDITVSNDAGVCGAVIASYGVTATDNASTPTLTFDIAEGTVFNVGTTKVTATAIDASGNSSQASFDVTVNDVEAPVLSGIPSDINLTADASTCSEVANWIAPTTTDNCSVSLTSTHNPGDTFPVGSTVVTYMATDPSGNSVSGSFTVTVTPAALNLTLTASGDVPNASIDAAVSGGCAPYSYQWNTGQTTEDLTNLDAGIYTLTVTDANGTITSATVEIEGSTCNIEVGIRMYPKRPVWKYGEKHTIYLGYGVQKVLLRANASGGDPRYTYDWTSDPSIKHTWKRYAWVSPKETTTYEVTVTDKNGCTAVETFTVKVIDIRCQHQKKRNKWNKWNKRWKQPQKVHICHNGRTICVSMNAVWAHLKRGATLGSCNDNSILPTVARPGEDISTDGKVEFSEPLIDLKASPNPVMDRTVIEFSSDRAGMAFVSVFDTQGQEVARLYEGTIEANQPQAVMFETNTVKSGLYIVRLQTQRGTRNLKLIIKK